jgi:RND family efflux transporter MFP subunit
MHRQALLPRRGKTTLVMPLPRTKISPPEAGKKKGSRGRNFAWLGLVLALVGIGAFFRYHNTSEAGEAIPPGQPAVRQVNVTTPQRASTGEITLPATIQAYQATDLFARVNGFLKAWHVDIGAPVKAGEVLAEIETPELDQELAQAAALLRQGQAEYHQAIAELAEARADVALAEANIAKAKANVEFAVNVAERSSALLRSRAVSREEFEGTVRERAARSAELESAKAELSRRQTNLGTRQAIIDSRESVVRNREANLQRLRDLTGFQKIIAPFDGIITRRTAEVGMLVTAGSNSGTHPLFRVAQTNVLRIQAAVPQSSALTLKPGDQARVTIPEQPGKQHLAKVTRTAGAVDPVSRSLLVEVELPNQEARLLPGVYAQIHFHSASNLSRLVIPANTLLMRSNGAHVVILSSDNTLRTQEVSLGRDFGATIEVLIGLEGEERLVVNPSDDFLDGQPAQVAASAASRVQLAQK